VPVGACRRTGRGHQFVQRAEHVCIRVLRVVRMTRTVSTPQFLFVTLSDRLASRSFPGRYRRGGGRSVRYYRHDAPPGTQASRVCAKAVSGERAESFLSSTFRGV